MVQIEQEISSTRQMYNRAVLSYKNKCEMFPSSTIAALFNFQAETFFDVDDNETRNVEIVL